MISPIQRRELLGKIRGRLNSAETFAEVAAMVRRRECVRRAKIGRKYRLAFSVVYSADGPWETIRAWHLPRPGRWRVTETGPSKERAGEHHRKWCAVLSKWEFCEFIFRCELEPDSVDTLGTIGAPGMERFGRVPAVCYRASDSGPVSACAYVTPFVYAVTRRGRVPIGYDFGRMKAAMLQGFDYY